MIANFTKTVAYSVSALALSAAAATAEKWDMPMAYAATNFHSEMGVVFADKVRDYTGGEIDITVHPGGSLFKGGEIKRAVQTGQAPIGERFMSAHANEAPLLGWDNLPFVATTYADNEKLWAAAKDKVNAQLSDLNLVALYTCPWPGQGFYFNKEVGSSADTQGVKFRSYNTATATFAEELGMIPVQIEAAELSQALATGVAEAFISSGSTGYDRKVWEHLSHYYKVNAWLPRNYVIVNKQAWEGLSDDMQAAVQKAADETGAACAAKSEELANWYFDQLSENGMTVTDASPEFLGELKAIGAKMTEEWLASVGDDGKAILDAYNGN
ncbi:TRAP transporter substrate-binding protein [Phaeobacter gallaeciensis]|jgi:TRAP-type C4-dicarboxylate transport system substrate-binding protein|uniref:TRAP transporter substrate-binding protein n=1 Tax=Phaeobacter gallaeciensis TaxID=60890 RepID=UPI00237F9745|nr:TRAP transporter substrate-binding protein [Phaeobacter gallaeciensis]MDE4098910.1 TRAP transporter substrate-binding protein [Phaeobacter gallaeciensis]MDE4107672.1 TRAP transporter substrate-binding protein [Phaeobacter gallaeciensis]MDE4112126.1 TRAP transporter substrate-binding protein [Phaeobacter gallaeciensis]MDE4116598.1 TRAP transporter substrate-binding protein [Phaeobacter gallaeciensis]MDE4121115.1 TRAP transporter substrate-binding protein [Phaeobacter gallaeciensis]